MRNLRQFLLTFMAAIATTAHANNIQVTNAALTANNSSQKSVRVKFDITWGNSWRTSSAPNNWDAAWVFAKFRVGASDPVLTGVSSTGTTLTVSSTAGLRVGMPLVKTAGTGTLAANTVITIINSATTITVNTAPTGTLSGATITARRIWEHARLHNADHTTGTGTSATIATGLLNPAAAFNATGNPGVGVFIHRSADGTGTFTANNVELRWNYGTQIPAITYADITEVKVFAIEMAHVPQGSFHVGDGGSGTGRFIAGGTPNTPFQITSEAALDIGNSTGSLWGTSTTGASTIGSAGTLSAAFPKGYNALYCMKHEIAQQDYADFLNTLTYAQQATRTANAPSSGAGVAALNNGNRNGIDIQTTGSSTNIVPAVYACNLNGNTSYGETADGQWIACNWLGWADVAAYLDWSGLRPMTELEYEKACRGPVTPVANEYAWGSASVTQAANITTVGAINESCGTTGANAVYANHGSVPGPMRTGVFATGATSRAQAGAGHYGILELSGNLWERAVIVGTATGRAYTGIHGDGGLNATGSADAEDWPDATGAGFRGSSYLDTIGNLRVSDREWAVHNNAARLAQYGGRGVRSAP